MEKVRPFTAQRSRLKVLTMYVCAVTTVGVVGSGKGMTSYEQKKRTKFLEE